MRRIKIDFVFFWKLSQLRALFVQTLIEVLCPFRPDVWPKQSEGSHDFSNTLRLPMWGICSKYCRHKKKSIQEGDEKTYRSYPWSCFLTSTRIARPTSRWFVCFLIAIFSNYKKEFVTKSFSRYVHYCLQTRTCVILFFVHLNIFCKRWTCWSCVTHVRMSCDFVNHATLLTCWLHT